PTVPVIVQCVLAPGARVPTETPRSPTSTAASCSVYAVVLTTVPSAPSGVAEAVTDSAPVTPAGPAPCTTANWPAARWSDALRPDGVAAASKAEVFPPVGNSGSLYGCSAHPEGARNDVVPGEDESTPTKLSATPPATVVSTTVPCTAGMCDRDRE